MSLEGVLGLHKLSLKIFYFWILGITSTMYILSYRGIPIFYYLAILGVFIIGKCSPKIDRGYLLYIFAIFFSLVVNVNNGYVGTMVLSFLLSVIICFLYMSLLTQKLDILESIISGIKLSCIVQIIWCYLQYIMYYILGLDINKIIFEDLFHTVENASRYVNGSLVLTGFCWHPSNMVPVLVLAIVFFNKWYIWLACVVVALNMNSSTIVLALLVLGFIKLIRTMTSCNFFCKLTVGKIIGILSIFFLLVLVFSISDLGNQILESIIRLIERIDGTHESLSTSAHRSYYSLLPQVFVNTPFLKTIFGYGPGCSGLAITHITGQYAYLGAWVVESDYMNVLYSYGIFGFIVYFGWLVQKIFYGGENGIIFVDFLIPLLAAGITYNVQYYWVIFAIIVFSLYQKKGNRII